MPSPPRLRLAAALLLLSTVCLATWLVAPPRPKPPRPPAPHSSPLPLVRLPSAPKPPSTPPKPPRMSTPHDILQAAQIAHASSNPDDRELWIRRAEILFALHVSRTPHHPLLPECAFHLASLPRPPRRQLPWSQLAFGLLQNNAAPEARRAQAALNLVDAYAAAGDWTAAHILASTLARLAAPAASDPCAAPPDIALHSGAFDRLVRFAFSRVPPHPPDRVRAVEPLIRPLLRARFESIGLPFPPREIFLRAFKRERLLELWARPDRRSPFRLAAFYPFHGFSGQLGPKRRKGDGQIPEGSFLIDRFNPHSAYFLSLGLNYPTPRDRARAGSDDPGGDIFIHGGSATVGCIPLGDPAMSELYLCALAARDSGQHRIPVQIHPLRLPDELPPPPDPATAALWSELAALQRTFDSARSLD